MCLSRAVSEIGGVICACSAWCVCRRRRRCRRSRAPTASHVVAALCEPFRRRSATATFLYAASSVAPAFSRSTSRRTLTTTPLPSSSRRRKTPPAAGSFPPVCTAARRPPAARWSTRRTLTANNGNLLTARSRRLAVDGSNLLTTETTLPANKFTCRQRGRSIGSFLAPAIIWVRRPKSGWAPKYFWPLAYSVFITGAP